MPTRSAKTNETTWGDGSQKEDEKLRDYEEDPRIFKEVNFFHFRDHPCMPLRKWSGGNDSLGKLDLTPVTSLLFIVTTSIPRGL